MSNGYFGIPKIRWGNSLENTIFFEYPLYDWVTRSEALDGSQFLRIESGYEDSWIVNTSYVLEGVVRYITQEQWDDDWVPFLEWARQKNTFRWYANYASSLDYIVSYLVEPIIEPPTIEPDGTRTIRLVIRNATEPYEIPRVNPRTIPSGSFPTDGLVLWLDNSLESYPGTGNTWYDLSGNEFDYTRSGSITFDRQLGWSTDAKGLTLTNASKLTDLAAKWSGSSPVSNSMHMFISATPDTTRRNAGLFALWESSGCSTYKFAISQNDRLPTGGPNPGSQVAAFTLQGAFKFNNINPSDFLFHFTDNTTGKIVGGAENIISWDTSGSTSNIYNNVSQSLGVNPSYPLAQAGNNITGKTWTQDIPCISVIGQNFVGYIRTVAIYNRILTPAEQVQVSDYLKALRTYNP